MNIAYVRKTNKSVAEVAEGFKNGIKAEKIELIGEKKLSGQQGVLIYFVNPAWTETVIAVDPTLIGLVPSTALIAEKDGKTIIGISNPQLLAGGPREDGMEAVVEEMDLALRKVVQSAAGVGEPKVEKIKLYSTETCPYCKMEKEYLEKNNVKFDLVMVDADRNAAEEMVRKSGQRGVPQTEVIYDDGDSEIIMGFDRHRLNQLLSIGK